VRKTVREELVGPAITVGRSYRECRRRQDYQRNNVSLIAFQFLRDLVYAFAVQQRSANDLAIE